MARNSMNTQYVERPVDEMTRMFQESAHHEWLANPGNRNFLKRLENRRQEYLQQAELLSSDDTANLKIRILLAKSLTIKEIITSLQTKPELISKAAS